MRSQRFYGQLNAGDVQVRTAVIDTGSITSTEHDVSFSDADVSPDCRVRAWVSNQPAPGRDADDAGMDAVTVTATARTGRVEAMLVGHSGPFTGPHRIDYTVHRGL